MATRSELLELARRMEREPEGFQIMLAPEDGGEPEGCAMAIEHDSHEWAIIIDALRVAAEAQTVG